MAKRIPLIGVKFGRLKVLKIHHVTKQGAYYLCECKCRNTVVVRASHLISGDTKSCGCIKKEKATQTIQNYFQR